MSYDLGMLLLRLVVGGLMFGHGAQKLFGWFGGHGLAVTGAFFGSQLRLRPARLWALLAALSEAGGGVLLALGLLNPLGSLGIIAALVVAVILVHWPRLWATDNGIEYHLVLIASALTVALSGPGSYALDAVLGTALPEPASLLIGLALVIVGVVVVVATRDEAVAEAGAAAERRAA